MPYAQRNAKKIGVGLLIWVVACLVGYLTLRTVVQGLEDRLYDAGLSQTKSFVKKIASPLLDNDTLAMNKIIGQISAGEEFVFALVLNHENRIVGHTDPELADQVFFPLDQAKLLDNVDGVSIEKYLSANGQKNIAFSKDVTFSGVKIGKAYVVLSGTDLHTTAKNYRRLYALGVVLCLLVLSAVLLALDRIASAKVLKAGALVKMGPYILKKRLATGGMAELFVASYERRDGFRKTVALKRVLPQLADKPEFINMFIREARLAALLRHPNVVQVIDFGKFKNTYFLAMEYIRGRNLDEFAAAVKRLPIDQAIFIVSGVAMGLQYSHSKKDDKSGEPMAIVHRDISPQNILVSFDGEVKISDYGISKATSEITLTQAGVVKGKLSYLSPEQALGEPVDHQTDIYALGIVFYEILSGEKMHGFTNGIEALRCIAEKKIRPISELRSDIPDELNRIVMKCLEKDKTSRYQNAQELLDDLVAFRNSLNMNYDSTMLSEFMKRHFREEKAAEELAD